MAYDPEENDRRAEEDDGEEELGENVKCTQGLYCHIFRANLRAGLQGAEGRCDLRY